MVAVLTATRPVLHESTKERKNGAIIMYSRILVPLDGSPLAEQVLPYVRQVATALKSPVELLRVMEPMPAGLANPRRGVYVDKTTGTMRHHDQDYLDELASPLKEAGVDASCGIREGDAAVQIVKEAERKPGTLIAMSTHGRSGIARWVFGSVTDRVLHTTTSPLLVVRSHEEENAFPDTALKTVIVPLDGSDMAEQVLPHVAALAKAAALKVVLLRVIPTIAYAYAYSDVSYSSRVNDDLLSSLEEEAASYLNEVRERLLKQGVATVEERMLRGQPGGSIVDTALDTPDHLVAMTTHGRSGLGRWVMGSVADRVVRHSGGPVLVIRANEDG